jgi:predicted Zn finger-like uncharacterized protein
MIIECPACATRFGAPDAAFAFGARKVRCSQCSHLWEFDPKAVAPEPNAAPESPEDRVAVEAQDATDGAAAADAAEAGSEDEDTAPPIAADSPLGESVVMSSQIPASTRVAAFAVPLAAVFVVATVVGWAAWQFRDAVVAAIPATQPIYAAWLGEPSSAHPIGLQIKQSETKAMNAGGRTLTVAGQIVNTATQPQVVPEMRAVLVGKDQQVLESWTFRAPVSQLQPGQSTPFETKIDARPDSAAEVKIGFVEATVSR